jgi:hypothetical protein
MTGVAVQRREPQYCFLIMSLSVPEFSAAFLTLSLTPPLPLPPSLLLSLLLLSSEAYTCENAGSEVIAATTRIVVVFFHSNHITNIIISE